MSALLCSHLLAVAGERQWFSQSGQFQDGEVWAGLSNLALNLAAQQMTPVQILEAERRVQEWRVNHNTRKIEYSQRCANIHFYGNQARSGELAFARLRGV